MRLAEPYRPRPVRCLEVAGLDGWRIKVYGIAYTGAEPDRALVRAARDAARRALPAPAVTGERYGVGFLVVHQGRTGNFVFVDWWATENELHHRIWFSDHAEPTALRPARPDDPVACTWDLSVVAHERGAWVTHVLARAGGPDLDGYLAAQMDGEV